MRAVNLIPMDDRKGADRSGGAVYVLLGVLGALVLMTAAWTLVNNQVKTKQADLEQLSADTTAAQQQAAALAPFRTFADLRTKRVETVKSLANSRFDWGPVLRKMAMVLPKDVWLTSMVGTVAPGVTLDGAGSSGGGDTSALRNAMPGPAVELTGCTGSQAEVARVMTRLRLIDGVTRVSLASSKKSDKGTIGSKPSTGGAGQPSSGGGTGDASDCRGGKDIPQFSIVVFFDPVGTDAVPAVGGTGTTTPGAATPAAGSGTTPAQPGATQPTSGTGGGS